MKKMLSIILQEIADVRLELKQDISNLDTKFTYQFHSLSEELHSFRKETNLNFATFVRNHDGLEKRVKKLEDKVGV